MKIIITVFTALLMAAPLAAKDKSAYTEDLLAKYEVQVDLGAIRISQARDSEAAQVKVQLDASAKNFIAKNLRFVDERDAAGLYRLVQEQYAKLEPGHPRAVTFHLFRSDFTAEGMTIGDQLYLRYDGVKQLSEIVGGESVLLATIAHELGHQVNDFARIRLIESQPYPEDVKAILRLRLEKRADREAAQLLQAAGLDPHCLITLLQVLHSGTHDAEDSNLDDRLATVTEVLKTSRIVASIGSR